MVSQVSIFYQGWAENSAPGIYRWNLLVFPGMANKAQVANNGKYNFFAAKYWQILANITFLPRNTGKYCF